MTETAKYDKILPVTGGYVYCPRCRPVKTKLLKIPTDTSAHNLRLYCRKCKTEFVVDVEQGQCFESRSR